MKNRGKELCLRPTYAEGKAVGIAPMSNLCRRCILCRRLCGRAGLFGTYAEGPDKKPSAQGLAVGIDPHSCSGCCCCDGAVVAGAAAGVAKSSREKLGHHAGARAGPAQAPAPDPALVPVPETKRREVSRMRRRMA